MNFMGKIEAPFAGALQTAVDRLPEILAPVDPGAGDVDEARAARRIASGNLKAAEEAFRNFAQQHRVGPEEHAAVKSARAAVTRAETQMKAAAVNFQRAKDRRHEVFLQETLLQLDEVAPTLLEVIRVLNDAVAPLARLHYHAAIHQLPMPRLLAMVPTLQEATRTVTAIANAATAPATETKED